MSFTVEREGARTWITFDDGGVNRLGSRALRDLTRIVAEVDRSTRLVVFRSGRPGVFAAGADMREMAAMDRHEAQQFSRTGQAMMATLGGLHAASAVIVDGECHGGAFDLATAFDIRIASGRSRFEHPGAKLGIVTGFGGTWRVPRMTPAKWSRSILLDGSRLDAADAFEAGLVDFVVDAIDSQETASLLESAELRWREISVMRLATAAAVSMDDEQLALLCGRAWELRAMERWT